MAKPDWGQIQADFLATGMSYRTLAAKYGVSFSTLRKKAAAGKWRESYGKVVVKSEQLREQERLTEQLVEQARQEEASVIVRKDRAIRFAEMTDIMADKILEALDAVDVHDAYAIKLLAGALKDLRELQGLNKTALDIEEQQARIAKLRNDTRIVEGDEAGGVLILPVIDGNLIPPEASDE